MIGLYYIIYYYINIIKNFVLFFLYIIKNDCSASSIYNTKDAY